MPGIAERTEAAAQLDGRTTNLDDGSLSPAISPRKIPSIPID
jgi:hypothetical protein